MEMVGPAFLSQLLHIVTDNSSDACAAVSRLFQLMNSYLGSKVMLPSNHVRCADHSVQRGVISILVQVKAAINEKLRRRTGEHPTEAKFYDSHIVWRRSVWAMQVRNQHIRIVRLAGTQHIRCVATHCRSVKHLIILWHNISDDLGTGPLD